jgi:hypothetical protein
LPNAAGAGSLQGNPGAESRTRSVRTNSTRQGAGRRQSMAGTKVKVDWEVRDYHINFLKDMAEKYGIKDEAKAMRVLIDFALQDGDLEKIFDKKNMRCIACGGAF